MTDPKLTEAMRVTALSWAPIEHARSNEDPTTEIVGWEASTPFGTFYTVEEYFGSDSLGWNVSHDVDEIGDADNPDEAKLIAEIDYVNRIKSVVTAQVIATALAEKDAVIEGLVSILQELDELREGTSDDELGAYVGRKIAAFVKRYRAALAAAKASGHE